MEKLLEKDGWTACGKVNRYDESVVDMLSKSINYKEEYIAIWDE